MRLEVPLRPQPSERWAMYRLICPVVDRACDESGLEPFFEYSQPNGPNRRLSADIALMRRDQPIWLIEAKKFSQRLHPDLVAPYLKEGMMGIVTNGNYWVFCVNGKTFTAGPLLNDSRHVERTILDQLVSLIATEKEEHALAQSHAWNTEWVPFQRYARPEVWRTSAAKGTRLFAEKQRFSTLRDAVLNAKEHVASDSVIGFFLEEIIESGQEISVGEIEVSEKRLIWWLPDGRRGARINLEGRHLEILFLNEFLDLYGRTRILGSLKMHDKNHAMSVCKATTLGEIRSVVRLFGLSA
jgi:hypothetical protein